jgi:hypothetical protein
MKKLVLVLTLSLAGFSGNSYAMPCYMEYQNMVELDTPGAAMEWVACMNARAATIDG